jgi:hypothetical protein
LFVGGFVKKIKIAIIVLGLITLVAGAAHAQFYGYANGYGGYPPVDPYAAYDPYYELHVMHYQLYLGQYGYYSYSYPYVVPSAPVIITPSAVAAPARRTPRATAPTARRR